MSIVRRVLVLLGLVLALAGWMQCGGSTPSGCTDDSDCITGDPPCMGTCSEGACSWQGQACFTRE